MNIVLDTHVFLWLSNGDEIPKNIENEFKNSKIKLFISAITAWEIFMLIKKDFILLDRPAQVWIEDSLKQNEIECIDVNIPISYSATVLKWEHKDPADRIIVATANHIDAKLATCDKQIIKSKLVNTI